MAYDEQLASRVRDQLETAQGVVEKKMFGGVAFLINGNMSLGIHKNELIVRIPPEETAEALTNPGVRICDIAGRPMKGWLMVGTAGLNDTKTMAAWIRRGVSFASSLPKKTGKKNMLGPNRVTCTR